MNLPNHSINKHMDLHRSQILVLNAIIDFSNKHGYAPTVRELCNILGFKSTSTVHNHLNKLETKGYIMKNSSSARCITITDKVFGDNLYSNSYISLNLNDELELMMKNLKNVINCDALYIDNVHAKKRTLLSISKLVTDALIKIDNVSI